MFRLIFRVDQDVVEVYDIDRVNEVAESLIDIRLKRSRSISKAKGHNYVFKQAIPSLKCRLLFVLFLNTQPIVYITEV